MKLVDDSCWYIFYETNGEQSQLKVFAKSDREAREKANEMLKSILTTPFVITGSAVV